MFFDIGNPALCKRNVCAVVKTHIHCADRADIVHIYKERAVYLNKFPVLQQAVAYGREQFCADNLFPSTRIVDNFAVLGFYIDQFGQGNFMYANPLFSTRKCPCSCVFTRRMSSMAAKKALEDTGFIR